MPSNLSNRLVFIFSLAGFLVSAFLLYEYNISGPVICPVGTGCDIVRASSYSYFLGISIPVLGIVFYMVMAGLSVARSWKPSGQVLSRLQLGAAVAGVGFGVYLTSLEALVIKAFCFWCVLSFIISLIILLLIILGYKKTYGNRN